MKILPDRHIFPHGGEKIISYLSMAKIRQQYHPAKPQIMEKSELSV
jgi:hypothetical protein